MKHLSYRVVPFFKKNSFFVINSFCLNSQQIAGMDRPSHLAQWLQRESTAARTRNHQQVVSNPTLGHFFSKVCEGSRVGKTNGPSTFWHQATVFRKTGPIF